ncbi:MAG: DUF4838 domain-containing protein [Armatimonadota bacterium]
MIKTLYIVLGILLTSHVYSEEAKEYFIAKDSIPSMAVVVERNDDTDLKEAVDDLVNYIEKASGARLAVHIDGTVSGSMPKIFIGNTEYTASQKLPLDKLEYDGYIISPRDGNIIITGRSVQGTIYGIYGFLKDYIGVRWYMPGELWEVVPHANPLSVKISHEQVNPDFPYRVWHSGWYSQSVKKWCTRNRITTFGYERPDSPYRTFNHNLNIIFPVTKYGKEHPEYYSEINGKRFVPDNDIDGRGQPCFTNHDVIRITVETIRDYFTKNPDSSQYSVSINDNADHCMCSNCSALDSPYRTFRGTRSFSDSYFHYVEAVASEIAKSHPDKTIGCFAYWSVELPPRHIKKLPSNVVIQLTQDTSQYHDLDYKKRDREMFFQWSTTADRLIKYDYYGLGWFTPRYYPKLIADDLKFNYNNGAVGTYAEIFPYWATMNPMICMASELAWNIDDDPDRILNEYFSTLYGDAAPVMREFYDLLEKKWMKNRTGIWFQGLHNIGGETSVFDIKIMAEARGLLNKAEKMSAGLIRDRIKHIRDYFDFSYTIESGYDTAITLKDLPLVDREDADILIREMSRTLRIVRSAEIVYDKTLKPDEVYLLYYKPETSWFKLGAYYKLDIWEDMLTNAVNEQVQRSETWAEANMKKSDADSYILKIKSDISRINIRRKMEFTTSQ